MRELRFRELINMFKSLQPVNIGAIICFQKFGSQTHIINHYAF